MNIPCASTYVAFGPASFTNSTLNNYVNILTGAGGAPVTADITKAAGSDLLVRLEASVQNTGGADNHRLGVNDGTTDWELGRNRMTTTGTQRSTFSFERLLTGLAAGPFTITARDRCSFGTAVFSTLDSICLTVLDTKFLNVANLYTAFAANTAINNVNYTTLTNGAGTNIAVALTKLSAATKIRVRAGVSTNQTAVASGEMGINDGVATTTLARMPISASAHGMFIGEALLSDLPIGARNYTMQLRGAANISFLQTSNAAFITVTEVLA